MLAPLGLAATALTSAYVASSLRLLRVGAAKHASVTGMRWMRAGLAALTFLAATLGVAVGPIGTLLGAALPEQANAIALSLVMVLLGLIAGWLIPARQLLGPISGAAEIGFRIGPGWTGLVVHPALALAQMVDRVDGSIHQVVLSVGGLGLTIARLLRRVDERGIDGLIGALVRVTQWLSLRARRLQSGLVYRELVLAAGGALIIAALLLVAR